MVSIIFCLAYPSLCLVQAMMGCGVRVKGGSLGKDGLHAGLVPLVKCAYVCAVLMWFIKDKIDFRQYGGLKGNSITHYLIE